MKFLEFHAHCCYFSTTDLPFQYAYNAYSKQGITPLEPLGELLGLGVAFLWEMFTTLPAHLHPITSYDWQEGFLGGEKQQLVGDMM